MKKIAITGGIGSGKSAVCKILESLGEFVIYTDKINASLLTEPDYIAKLARIFADSVKDGVVDKRAIRQEISLDAAKRLQLNELAHSEIARRVRNIVDNFNGEEIFCEIPLIVECGMADYFDEIWCVVSDFDVRVRRIQARDNCSKEDAENIINAQLKDDKLTAIANHIVNNNNDLIELRKEVQKLLCITKK